MTAQSDSEIPVNPLARDLNDRLLAAAPEVLEMLSGLGRRLYFPKGILSQSAEANQKAHRFNATIGIATEGDGPMQDVFVVQVSDDGGATWVNLETVGPSGPEVNGG